MIFKFYHLFSDIFETGAVFAQFIPEEKVPEFGKKLKAYYLQKCAHNNGPTFKGTHETDIVLAKKI